MNIFNIFRKKKTELEIEEEITREIIAENSQNRKAESIVIRYKLEEDQVVPTIVKICDFHGNILPSEGSIIWAPDENNTKLLPYKVKRFDFIEDPETDASSFNYIVVVPAQTNEITNIDY